MTETAPVEELPRPRIRIGAVLWGLALAAVAATVLWIAASPTRRVDAVDAVLALDAFGWTIVVVIVLGALTTLLALAAVIRSAQRRLSERRRPAARQDG